MASTAWERRTEDGQRGSELNTERQVADFFNREDLFTSDQVADFLGIP